MSRVPGSHGPSPDKRALSLSAATVYASAGASAWVAAGAGAPPAPKDSRRAPPPGRGRGGGGGARPACTEVLAPDAAPGARRRRERRVAPDFDSASAGPVPRQDVRVQFPPRPAPPEMRPVGLFVEPLDSQPSNPSGWPSSAPHGMAP